LPRRLLNGERKFYDLQAPAARCGDRAAGINRAVEGPDYLLRESSSVYETPASYLLCRGNSVCETTTPHRIRK
jgi:hypothetical protein